MEHLNQGSCQDWLPGEVTCVILYSCSQTASQLLWDGRSSKSEHPVPKPVASLSGTGSRMPSALQPRVRDPSKKVQTRSPASQWKERADKAGARVCTGSLRRRGLVAARLSPTRDRRARRSRPQPRAGGTRPTRVSPTWSPGPGAHRPCRAAGLATAPRRGSAACTWCRHTGPTPPSCFRAPPRALRRGLRELGCPARGLFCRCGPCLATAGPPPSRVSLRLRRRPGTPAAARPAAPA